MDKIDRINIHEIEQEFEKLIMLDAKKIYDESKNKILRNLKKIFRIKEKEIKDNEKRIPGGAYYFCVGRDEMISPEDYYVRVSVYLADKYEVRALELVKELFIDDGLNVNDNDMFGSRVIDIQLKELVTLWNFRLDGHEYNKNIIG